MARFHLIQIGSVYLTSTGLVGGIRCKTRVTGLDELFSGYAGASVVPIDGPHHNFKKENNGEGVEIKIEILTQWTASVMDTLNTAFNTAFGSDASIVCIFTGFKTWNLDCQPIFPKPIAFPGDFSGALVTTPTIYLGVTDINSIT